MSLLKCCVCCKPSNEFPCYFKTVLTDFIELFNLQSCRSNSIKLDKLTLCKSCWIYFMRAHQLQHELRLKKEACDAKKTFLTSKIRQSQTSLLASGTNYVASSVDLEVQISANEHNDDNDSNASEQTVGWDPAEAISSSLNNTDESDNESCETAKVIATDNLSASAGLAEKLPTEVISNEASQSYSQSEAAERKAQVDNASVSAKSAEKDPTEVTSDSESEAKSDPAKPNPLIDSVSPTASSQDKEPVEVTLDDTNDSDFEPEPSKRKTRSDNKPTSASSSSEGEPTEVTSDDTSESDSESERVKSRQVTLRSRKLRKKVKRSSGWKIRSSNVKKLSETEFTYLKKYPFSRIDVGFKCGLCPAVSNIHNGSSSIEYNMLRHIERWHISEERWHITGKSTFTYENKWLPKNITLPKTSEIVKQTSETDFLYMDKYPFQGTEFGFKCGLCRVVSSISPIKRSSPWVNLTNHIKKWHMGNQDVMKMKSKTQRCFQVGPDRFQYGRFLFEKVDGMFRCGECGVLKIPSRSGPDKTKNILQHISDHHYEKILKEYVCEYCGVKYNNRDSLRCHKKAKHEYIEGQFPCSECGKDFVSASSVRMHIKRVHLKQRDFICENCGKAFSHRAGLEIHVAAVHRKEKIKCEECGKVFGWQAALKVHLASSHKGKKYSCDICGMDFTQGYSVTRHKKTAHNV